MIQSIYSRKLVYKPFFLGKQMNTEAPYTSSLAV